MKMRFQADLLNVKYLKHGSLIRQSNASQRRSPQLKIPGRR